MQATLRLSGSSIARGLPRRPRQPALLALSSSKDWAGPSQNGSAYRQQFFGSKTAPVSPPVHATPHYMDYDTLVDMHLITRQSFGDRPLFGTKRGDSKESPFEWLTYKDFGKKVDECRAALAGLGISRGDSVGIISNNREEWAVCAYATYSLGGVFVPMYEEQVRGEERRTSSLVTLFFFVDVPSHPSGHLYRLNALCRLDFSVFASRSWNFQDFFGASYDMYDITHTGTAV